MSYQSWLRGRTIIYNPLPKQSAKPRKFHIGRILWTALKRTCMVIGAIILFSAVVGVIAASRSGGKAVPTLPDNMVLTLHLSGSFPEESGHSQYLSLIRGGEEPLTVSAVVDAIDRAAIDDHVKALAIKASSVGYNISQLQEIRSAITRFKSSGKKTYIYSESFGGGGYGLGLYYLASAFDQIWMQPVGVVSIGGINAEMPFFKGVMEKYGVEGQFFQRKEYKNAMEHLTSRTMSVASRESMQGLIDNLAEQLISPIKADRKSLKTSFDDLMNLGMITDEKALQVGLLDRLDYEDVLLKELKKGYQDANLISVSTYATVKKRTYLKQQLMMGTPVSVAVIHVDGLIVSGAAKRSPYGVSEEMAAADDIVVALHDAANNKKVKAIILRVNSPGGSPSASETIARAVTWVQDEKKKPVYVSMGNAAASGGYWISAGATKIYAMNSTLTGSIGVVGGKVNLEKLWQKYDVNWEKVSVGKNSGMMSMNTPFSPSEQKQFELTLDNTYDHFINRVARGRKLTPEQVENLAKGHVWTGIQAREKGLVDEIGSMNDVLDFIAKENGVASRYDLTVFHLPSVDDPFEILFELLSAQAILPESMTEMLAEFSTMMVMRSNPQLAIAPSLPQNIR